jgi:hypothetical protein
MKVSLIPDERIDEVHAAENTLLCSECFRIGV